MPSLRSRSLCCWWSLRSRPGSALRCQGPTPPARSRPRRPTRPGPAARGRRPSARPRRRPGSQRGRLRIPIRASPRAWSRQGPKGPAAAATGPCCYHEPSWHCRPGGGSAPNSRAAATGTVPPGGARAPVLGPGRIRASARRSSAQAASPGRAAGPASPPAPVRDYLHRDSSRTLVIPSGTSSTWACRRHEVSRWRRPGRGGAARREKVRLAAAEMTRGRGQ